MATNVPGNTARDNHEQQVSTIRKTLTFADALALPAGFPIGMLPAGAMILTSHVDVSAAFNAATTNDVSVGTNATAYDNILTGAQVLAGAVGAKRGLAPTLRVDQVTAPTMVFIKYTGTGAAATAGQLTLVIEFAVNRDL